MSMPVLDSEHTSGALAAAYIEDVQKSSADPIPTAAAFMAAVVWLYMQHSKVPNSESWLFMGQLQEQSSMGSNARTVAVSVAHCASTAAAEVSEACVETMVGLSPSSARLMSKALNSVLSVKLSVAMNRASTKKRTGTTIWMRMLHASRRQFKYRFHSRPRIWRCRRVKPVTYPARMLSPMSSSSIRGMVVSLRAAPFAPCLSLHAWSLLASAARTRFFLEAEEAAPPTPPRAMERNTSSRVVHEMPYEVKPNSSSRPSSS
mmetsp:Transcript_29163/g.72063  ORF Transcript_29163/g.72063 Transcript_29163/m.72063 type:complete len:261 (-) Transcript_29163:1953-2735(-)